MFFELTNSEVLNKPYQIMYWTNRVNLVHHLPQSVNQLFLSLLSTLSMFCLNSIFTFSLLYFYFFLTLFSFSSCFQFLLTNSFHYLCFLSVSSFNPNRAGLLDVAWVRGGLNQPAPRVQDSRAFIFGKGRYTILHLNIFYTLWL